MAGIVVEPMKLVYWPIPKNACTALKRHFARLLGIEYGQQSIHSVLFQLTEEPLPGFQNLVVVRNPFARLYSLWVNKIADGHPESPHFVDGLDVHVFGQVWRQRIWSGMAFEDFAHSVLDSNIPPDPHWAPQSSLVPEEVTEYIHLEVLAPILSLLIPKENASHIPGHWTRGYDLSLCEFVRKYYEADFKRFDYDE